MVHGWIADLPMSGVVTSPEIRSAAFDLLARREHARQELIDKIYRRFSKRKNISIDKSMIATVVNNMADEGLQSDTRYFEILVHSRKQQGYGPFRISQELKQKMAMPDAGKSLGDTNKQEWKARAQEVRQKKFGEDLPKTPKEKAQQMRFLQYRGFNMEQIRFAMSVNGEADS
jgi:regulatory protein